MCGSLPVEFIYFFAKLCDILSIVFTSCKYFNGLIAFFSLSFANSVILHLLFFLSGFAPYLFGPFLILHPIVVFNCTFAPYLFANRVILHLLFFFLSDFAPHLLPHFPSFNGNFEQSTIGKR